jgi:ClpP class serine protease
MREQFINKLVSQPWNIDRMRGRTIIGRLVQRLQRPHADRPAEDICGDPLPKMNITGDVAVIPVRGSLMMNVPDWIKECGLDITDIDDILAELAQAQADPNVRLIVLDFDSPGGWSYAGNKLFDAVQQSQAQRGGKPIFAYCADGADVCSAAYQGATPARMFLTGQYALAVGCIGTYLALLDDSEMFKQMGITFHVLRSGDLKGIGEDEVTDKQIAWLQSVVDTQGAAFRANVARYRLSLSKEEMQGQYYDGATAYAKGFTHGFARDINAAIAIFRQQL